VGLEFLSILHQDYVDQFLGGQLPEGDFLRLVEWGEPSFDFYREQTLAPRQTGGRTLALNAPRWLTRKISQTGLDSLTPEERQLLPADFTMGNDAYKERFRAVMGGHVAEEKLDRYFQAQSAWDEAMATTSCTHQRLHPGRDLVIIVGDFHAAYGGGLPDRMKARGCQNVKVISQVQVDSLDHLDKDPEILPHPNWGPRADWIWASTAP
jgi:uncharacterized iron-regulated protein